MERAIKIYLAVGSVACIAISVAAIWAMVEIVSVIQ